MNVKRIANKVPDYPGRNLLERLVGPLTAPLAGLYAGHTIQRLLGFWAMHSTYGNLAALVEAGIYSRSGVWKQSREFFDVFGCEVDDFLPEISAQLHASGLALKVGFPEMVQPSKHAQVTA